MKTLLILRHAKAEPIGEAQTDHDRLLTGRGQRDANTIGSLLRESDLTPQLVLSSTAFRARDTALAVMQASLFAGRAEFLHELYLAHPSTYLEAIQTHGESFDSVLMVAHNPGLEEMVRLLTGRLETMPTAGLAVLRAPIASWRELAFEMPYELERFVRPKEL